MSLRKVFPFAFLAMATFTALAQDLPDLASPKDLPSTSKASAKYQRLQPLSIHGRPDFLVNGASPTIPAGGQITHASTTSVISVASFPGFLLSRGKTWPFTMIGRAPTTGATANVPAHILAVSLKLQNANLVTFTTVSVTPFEAPVLGSPNFQPANYSSGSAIQFADAVQRAEFFHIMLPGWHTALRPATIVHNVTINVPRFTTAILNGRKIQTQTYFTAKADDGRTVVFLLDQFFDQQIFNLVVSQINAGRFATNALNIALFPNTFLFSLNNSGGMGDCCVLGFHTYFTDNGKPRESRWVFAFASWISPGVFSGGFQDVTALSHEISEAFNDPFVDNVVPAWQFPGEPGTCADDLEVGDPVEVLASAVFPMHLSGMIYHPQTEALLQWFKQKSPSTALNGAFSYPNTKALTSPATPFGPLACP